VQAVCGGDEGAPASQGPWASQLTWGRHSSGWPGVNSAKQNSSAVACCVGHHGCAIPYLLCIRAPFAPAGKPSQESNG
jgi:hypothetical protein